jgi:glycerol-3-phosphate dehydrogenase
LNPGFGFPLRTERLAALEQTLFDVLVVGGGITGAAIARDAATRGLRVAVVEREDWACGTSWRSTKLVHGGLRYLKTGDVRLVFESLSERGRLARLAPHLVRPVEFVFPAYRGRGLRPWMLDLGLTAYDLLALGRTPRRHRRLSREELLRMEPALESPALLSGAVSSDARTDDARLTLENVLDAVSLEAVAVSRVQVAALLHDAAGAVSGAEVVDRESGRRFTIRARVVISATGPWADRVRSLDEPGAPPRLRLAKGIHLTLPARRLPVTRPVAFPASGGRLLFAVPDGPVTLLGTTDTDYTGSLDEVTADPAEVAYLLKEANETFPAARLTEPDVVATFASLRPLVREPGKRVEDTSREDALLLSADGLLTVTGGKLTTHRRMAARAMDRVARLLAARGVAVPAGRTESRPFPGAPATSLEESVSALLRIAVTSDPPIDAATADHLARRYGARAVEVLDLAAGDSALSRPLCPDLPDIEAEIVFAARREDARSLADALIRRTHLFWQAPRQGEEALERAASLMARELGWSEAKKESEIADYRREVALSRRFRGRTSLP